MSNLTISGERMATLNQNSEHFVFETEIFKLTSDRSATETTQQPVAEDAILELTFSDGSQWLVAEEDYPELTPTKHRGANTTLQFPLEIVSVESAERGIVNKAVVIAVGYIKGKAKEKATGLAADLVSKKIAEAADKRLMPTPGFCRINSSFGLEWNPKVAENGQRSLLLIHGTASSTAGSFAELSKNKTVWDTIYNHYSGNIYGLEHYSLSVSPVQNALDILAELPENAELDVMTHSRGGLVGDILARCDRRNGKPAFSTAEIAKIQSEDDDLLAAQMKRVNELADQKTITIHKMVRVACPAAGTTLLSNRLDHYLNAVLTAIGFAFGLAAPIYGIIKTLLLEVIKLKTKPDAFPGLLAMIPDSPYQQINNDVAARIQGELYVIAGNAEFGGGFGHSLAVIFTNLFYRGANDFVVDTKSMHKGLRRESGYFFKLEKRNDVSHFNYFENPTSRELIQAALTLPAASNRLFEVKTLEDYDRGLITKILDLDPFNLDSVRGKRPIVVLIPGIMGSTLAHNGDTIWLDLKRMNKGGIVNELGHNSTAEANGVIGRFYKKLALELNATFDVRVFPFDWRISTTTAANDLKKLLESYEAYNQPISLVAHSMGGLVLRQLMMDHDAFYKEFINKPTNKTIFLGTPWLGSYLIMEVFTGHSSRVKQINFIDFSNGKNGLLNTFVNYEGLYDLLPVDDEKLDEATFWQMINDTLQDPKFCVPPSNKLAYFAKNKARIRSFNFDFTNTFYVVGADEKTTNGYTLQTSSRSASPILYTSTPYGDGSVTWDSGIPKGLDPKRVFYTNVSHMDLSNEKTLFGGIKDLISKGSTLSFSNVRPTNRGAELAVPQPAIFLPATTEEEMANAIFGVGKNYAATLKSSTEKLEITVSHGSLAYAQYPLLVGHFDGDGIISAEEALDKCLNGKLKERHRINQYPQKIGEQLITFNLQSQPIGGIIVGLGDVFGFNVYGLSKTVEKAVVQYALFIRDNYTTPKALAYSGKLSALFIGSGYGGLNLRDSVRAIVDGVSRANVTIAGIGQGLVPISQLEFVDYYEDVVQFGYYVLSDYAAENDNVTLKKGILSTRGGKKRVNNDTSKNWWHSFSTTIQDPENHKSSKLDFVSSSGIARVEKDQVATEVEVLELIVKGMATNKVWEPKAAKTLFELIVPNAFKDVLRNHNNIQWKMDEFAAQFPWEMFHDSNSGKEPTFTKAGLIRQLISARSFAKPNFVNSNTALVIADPLYNDPNLPQLPFAKLEGEKMAANFEAHQFAVSTKINATATDILTEIFAKEFRLMHICGHGLYDPENGKVGLAIGSGLLLTPGTFNQLSYVPELVFINCCHAGNINFADERYTQSRNKLAANIGTQLIHLGAKAVIVAAWAIDDGAALKFAEVFYDALFSGHYYGDAVLKARSTCFELFPNTNTWGAYQCYGDQFFKLRAIDNWQPKGKNYVLPNQVIVDLQNLRNDVIGAKKIDPYFGQELSAIVEAARANDFRDAAAIELEAHIYAEMGDFAEAVNLYNQLPHLAHANFSFRAIEQALTLESKLLLQRQKNGENVNKELTAMLKKTNILNEIGASNKRKSVMGSIYRRAAQTGSTAAQVKYLRSALDAYAESYALMVEPEVDGYVLNNLLVLAVLVFSTKKERNDYFESQNLAHFETLVAAQLTTKEVRNQWTDFRGFAKFKAFCVASILECECAKNEIYLQQALEEYLQHMRFGARRKEILTEVEYLEMLQLFSKELGISAALANQIEVLLNELKNAL